MPPTEGRDALHDQLTEFLWRVYGYPSPFADAHPVTQETYRADAAAVLEVIARGHVIVERGRWERVERAAGQWLVQAMADDLDGSRADNYAAAGLHIGDLPGFDVTAPAGDGEAGA
jgi:hypothetical protein